MIVAFRRIGELKPKKEDCVDRLGHFFHANRVDDDDKNWSVFLSVTRTSF